MCPGVCFLGPTSLGFTELPGFPGSLFPWPDWRSSPSLGFQISFHFLILPLLLLVPLWFKSLKTFENFLEVPKPVLIFLRSCFFILFWLTVSFFLLLQTVDLSPGFLPVTVGSLYIFLYFTFIAFTFSSILQPYSTNSVSFLTTSVLNCASDRLAISSSLSCVFSGTLICSFIPDIFFVSEHLLSNKGQSLRYSPGRGPCTSLPCDAVCGGGVWEGTIALALLSARFQSLSPLPTSKVGPSSADFQVGGFVLALGPCAFLQWTLLWGWEFLLLPQHPQVFSVRGLRLYFPTGTLFCGSVWLSSCSSQLSAHRCGTPALPATALWWVLSAWLPGSALPADLGERFFIDSLDFHTIRFSVSCGFLFLHLLLSFFWLCVEAQCLYLHLRLGRKSHMVGFMVQP